MKVLVAMSGGVDSSIAAHLLKEQGYEVIGLSLELWEQRERRKTDVCCSMEAIEGAKAVAKSLGIEHYTMDAKDEFAEDVIERFCASYISGKTPNPCILCNRFIKFDLILKKAAEFGAEFIATGHYARVVKENSRSLLMKGIDKKKDQSYVLYVMTQEQLSKTLFPLGSLTKVETRQIAAGLGLPNASRPESQEICFVGDGKYIDFIHTLDPEAVKPGPIVDINGRVIGQHKGIAFYTIGQRKGLGVSNTSPFYVTAIDRQSNTVVVGPRESAMSKRFLVGDLNWVSIGSLSEEKMVRTKLRSTMTEAPAAIWPADENTVLVEFDEPQWAPAPGQSAVFYNGDLVIGGGVILNICFSKI